MALNRLRLIPQPMDIPAWLGEIKNPVLVYQASNGEIWTNPEFETVFGQIDLDQLSVNVSKTGKYERLNIKNRNGKSFLINLKTSEINSEDEKKFITFFEDLTSSTESQSTILQKEKLEQIGKYAGGILHNLSQPLQTICGASEGLSLTQNLSENTKDHIKDIRNATEYMVGMVRNLKSYLGNENEESIPFTAEECITHSVYLTKNTLLQHNIDLIVNSGNRKNAEIYGNKNQLVQVLINLITNAKDAIEQAGRTRGKIIIEQFVDQNHLEIIVKDNGCGMDDLTRKKIFTPLFTTKPSNHGTGMGLSSSLFYLQSLNAKINVNSKPGTGSEFKLTFPIIHSKGETYGK